ncbi:MAG: hypothetical protein JXR87_02585, partial [Candidatus Marinimicrobia bacterium]|nr:hypothetical protein [Candidatus Neomarinimicrobiota bacterium]
MKSQLVFCWLVLFWFAAGAGEYDFTIPDDQPPETMQISGNLDGKYSLFESRPNSPIFQLQYENQSLENLLAAYRMGFYLNGDYQTKDISVHFRTFTDYSHNNEINVSLYELYANLNLTINSQFLLGKRRYNWGKGYAFNPVGYVNSLKDPENPELAQSGLLS